MSFDRITVSKNRNFTVINNTIFKDSRVSCKARGLFATIMSLSDDWDFSVNGFTTILKEGRNTVYRVIDELIEHGYCQRIQHRDEKTKRFTETEYIFYEEPIPKTPNPENHNRENQTQYNNNKLNTSFQEVSDSIAEPANKPEETNGHSALKVKRSKRIYLPEDWEVPTTEIDRLAVQLPLVDMYEEINRFRKHYEASTTKSNNWYSKFLDWVGRKQKWQEEKAERTPYQSKQNNNLNLPEEGKGTLEQEMARFGLVMQK